MSGMESREFWARLARRINAVLSASRDNNIRFLWVDDIIAPASPPRRGETATTTAFVYGGSFVQCWVNLSLTEEAVTAYHNGEWSRILPEPDATDWVAISRTGKELQINIAL